MVIGRERGGREGEEGRSGQKQKHGGRGQVNIGHKAVQMEQRLAWERLTKKDFKDLCWRHVFGSDKAHIIKVHSRVPLVFQTFRTIARKTVSKWTRPKNTTLHFSKRFQVTGKLVWKYKHVKTIVATQLKQRSSKLCMGEQFRHWNSRGAHTRTSHDRRYDSHRDCRGHTRLGHVGTRGATLARKTTGCSGLDDVEAGNTGGRVTTLV